MSSNSYRDGSYLQTERLKIARERRGLTQRQLSRILGIGENQINKFENGGGEPSLRTLYLIAEELGVTADYLIGRSDEIEGYGRFDLREDQRKLLDAYTTGDSSTLFKLISDRLRQLEGEKA